MTAAALPALVVALLAGTLAGCAPADTPPDPGPPAGTEEPADPPGVEPPEPTEPGAPDEEPEPPAPAAPDPDREIRGVWVHLFDDTLKHPDGIAALVDELARADATAVFAQVARRHDAYYASRVLPRTPDPDLAPGLDVVAELTELAHGAGIEVHAWISVAPTWHDVYADLAPPQGWVAAEHGRDAPEEHRWVTRDVDGAWSHYLDPALPAVREHAAAVAVELVERTDVDGIHLDYVRYESDRHGYHPDALDRFRAETDAEGVPAPDDPRWTAWRRDQTRGLVAHVADAVDGAAAAAGRPVALSAAVVTWGAPPGSDDAPTFADTRPATEALQDWPAWAEEGLVDLLLPMTYFRDHVPEQAAWFAGWIAFQHDLAVTARTRVVPGVAGWLNRAEVVLDQVGAAMQVDGGAVVYSHQQPTDDPDDRRLFDLLGASGWGAPAG